MTRDISQVKLCSNPNCLICTAPGAVGKCRDQSITYQINCMRAPCNINFDPLKPTKVPQTPEEPLAHYVGETSRSGFLRGTSHLKDYRAKSQKCSLWRHTASHHGGDIGPSRGIQDYKMTKLRSWPRPLDRQTAEGSLIQDIELLETENRAICMNDKEDFLQSSAVSINYNMGSNK